MNGERGDRRERGERELLGESAGDWTGVFAGGFNTQFPHRGEGCPSEVKDDSMKVVALAEGTDVPLKDGSLLGGILAGGSCGNDIVVRGSSVFHASLKWASELLLSIGGKSWI